MANEPKRKPAEYTRFGNILTGQLARRGIRGAAQIARRVSARGDYPTSTGSLSDESVRNYLTGKHPVTVPFLHIIMDEMNKAELMSAEERMELEEAFIWGQGPNISPVQPENMDKASEYLKGIKTQEEAEDGGTARET